METERKEIPPLSCRQQIYNESLLYKVLHEMKAAYKTVRIKVKQPSVCIQCLQSFTCRASANSCSCSTVFVKTMILRRFIAQISLQELDNNSLWVCHCEQLLLNHTVIFLFVTMQIYCSFKGK